MKKNQNDIDVLGEVLPTIHCIKLLVFAYAIASLLFRLMQKLY